MNRKDLEAKIKKLESQIAEDKKKINSLSKQTKEAKKALDSEIDASKYKSRAFQTVVDGINTLSSGIQQIKPVKMNVPSFPTLEDLEYVIQKRPDKRDSLIDEIKNTFQSVYDVYKMLNAQIEDLNKISNEYFSILEYQKQIKSIMSNTFTLNSLVQEMGMNPKQFKQYAREKGFEKVANIDFEKLKSINPESPEFSELHLCYSSLVYEQYGKLKQRSLDLEQFKETTEEFIKDFPGYQTYKKASIGDTLKSLGNYYKKIINLSKNLDESLKQSEQQLEQKQNKLNQKQEQLEKKDKELSVKEKETEEILKKLSVYQNRINSIKDSVKQVMNVNEIRTYLQQTAFPEFEKNHKDDSRAARNPESPFFFYLVEEIKNSEHAKELKKKYSGTAQAVFDSKLSQAIHLENRFVFEKSVKKLKSDYDYITKNYEKIARGEIKNPELNFEFAKPLIEKISSYKFEDSDLKERIKQISSKLSVLKQSYESDIRKWNEKERAYEIRLDRAAEEIQFNKKQAQEFEDKAEHLESKVSQLTDSYEAEKQIRQQQEKQLHEKEKSINSLKEQLKKKRQDNSTPETLRKLENKIEELEDSKTKLQNDYINHQDEWNRKKQEYESEIARLKNIIKENKDKESLLEKRAENAEKNYFDEKTQREKENELYEKRIKQAEAKLDENSALVESLEQQIAKLRKDYQESRKNKAHEQTRFNELYKDYIEVLKLCQTQKEIIEELDKYDLNPEEVEELKQNYHHTLTDIKDSSEVIAANLNELKKTYNTVRQQEREIEKYKTEIARRESDVLMTRQIIEDNLAELEQNKEIMGQQENKINDYENRISKANKYLNPEDDNNVI